MPKQENLGDLFLKLAPNLAANNPEILKVWEDFGQPPKDPSDQKIDSGLPTKVSGIEPVATRPSPVVDD
jgi:hypothetical protein